MDNRGKLIGLENRVLRAGCWYAQMLGLDSRAAKCAVDLILYKSDLVQNESTTDLTTYKSNQVQRASYPLHIT